MATIKTFEEGDTIYASETNANNQALLSALTDNAAQVQSYVEGEIASIKSNVASVQATLQNGITSLNEALTSLKEGLFYAISPDYSKGTGIGSGAKISKAGWVNWNGGQIGDSSTAQMWINGVGVGYHSYYKYGDSYKTLFFVNKGDTVKFTGGTSVVFYPCKGFEEVSNG